jgi:hypothetical protein
MHQVATFSSSGGRRAAHQQQTPTATSIIAHHHHGHSNAMRTYTGHLSRLAYGLSFSPSHTQGKKYYYSLYHG